MKNEQNDTTILDSLDPESHSAQHQLLSNWLHDSNLIINNHVKTQIIQERLQQLNAYINRNDISTENRRLGFAVKALFHYYLRDLHLPTKSEMEWNSDSAWKSSVTLTIYDLAENSIGAESDFIVLLFELIYQFQLNEIISKLSYEIFEIPPNLHLDPPYDHLVIDLVTDPLSHLLSHDNFRVREVAANASSRLSEYMRGSDADILIDPLTRLLLDSNLNVRKAARRALDNLPISHYAFEDSKKSNTHENRRSATKNIPTSASESSY